MGVLDRVRAWWNPAQYRDDHPLTSRERVQEAQHEEHWWGEAQKLGGPGGWGTTNIERDFEKPE
jgi:hypothetical protein